MNVPIFYFSEAVMDGVSTSLEGRIREVIAAAKGDTITLTTNDGDIVATCSNEDELRNVLEEKKML